MTGICSECPNRDLCSALCPEAELYVKQDEKSQRELTIGIPKFGKWPEPKDKLVFTEKDKELLRLLIDGKSRGQIAQELGITRKILKDRIRHLNERRRKAQPIV